MLRATPYEAAYGIKGVSVGLHRRGQGINNIASNKAKTGILQQEETASRYVSRMERRVIRHEPIEVRPCA